MTFEIGDLVRVEETPEMMSYLLKYVGFTGRVFHVETVMSPYSGVISQVLGIRFAEFPRHISENASYFVKAN